MVTSDNKPNLNKLPWAVEFLDLWTLKLNQKELIFAILHNHLLINHYVDEFINKVNPNLGSISELKMDFTEKVKLIVPPENDPAFEKIFEGILQLNTVRNNMAHKLKYEFQKSAFSKMAGALDFMKLTKDSDFKFKKQDPVLIVTAFGSVAVGYLNNLAGKITKKKNPLVKAS